MNGKLNRQREDQQRLIERAAQWFNVLENPSADERAEFMDWISRSPRHLEEFLLTTAVAREIERVDLSSLESVQAALAPDSAQVVALPQAPAHPASTGDDVNEASAPAAAASPRLWKWAAVLATAAIAATLALTTLPPRWQSYSTDAGEQRTVQLPDGTVVRLNMRSDIRVRFSREQRSIRLVDGEALFTVAHDPRRPFRVQSGASVIQAVGTAFNVLRRPLGTTVSVIEGVVQVSAAADGITSPDGPWRKDGPTAALVADRAQTSVRLGAGEEVRIAVDGRVEKHQSINVVAVAPWRQHRLEFRTDALVDIAAEFNRYNTEPQITVIGDEIKTRHYSGVFDANDPGSLIEFLRRDPELDLEQHGRNIVIRPR